MSELPKYTFLGATSIEALNCSGAPGHEADGVIGVTVAVYKNLASISIGCPKISETGRCQKGGFGTSEKCIHLSQKKFPL